MHGGSEGSYSESSVKVKPTGTFSGIFGDAFVGLDMLRHCTSALDTPSTNFHVQVLSPVKNKSEFSSLGSFPLFSEYSYERAVCLVLFSPVVILIQV